MRCSRPVSGFAFEPWMWILTPQRFSIQSSPPLPLRLRAIITTVTYRLRPVCTRGNLFVLFLFCVFSVTPSNANPPLDERVFSSPEPHQYL